MTTKTVTNILQTVQEYFCIVIAQGCREFDKDVYRIFVGRRRNLAAFFVFVHGSVRLKSYLMYDVIITPVACRYGFSRTFPS